MSSGVQSNASSATSLKLWGLNIQWPFSQLLLHESKTLEIRGYPLGCKNIAMADQETWLVETAGPVANASKNAIIDSEKLGKRPQYAQIIGTVIFSKSGK